ncbi:MAG: 2-phospho-L-lactate guanylyltransferase [Candidatus Aminicenantes bacterium]|nr:2-phospho-L-lactate guanylyltransferase [Candidatus Aminicenantes bacterium]
MKVVLLPVKELAQAKRRMAPWLSRRERAGLVWAMLEDVGRALASAKLADKVVVAGRDPELAAYADRRRWDFIRERSQTSESRSVDESAVALRQQGATSVLRVPVDVPLIEGRDVDALLGRPLAAPAALLVPSRDGRGTNALLRMPPDAFPSRFGRDSLRRHLAAARRARVDATVFSNPRFGLDLDGPEDLVRFWQGKGGAATRSYLAGSGLAARLAGKGWGLHE